MGQFNQSIFFLTGRVSMEITSVFYWSMIWITLLCDLWILLTILDILKQCLLWGEWRSDTTLFAGISSLPRSLFTHSHITLLEDWVGSVLQVCTVLCSQLWFFSLAQACQLIVLNFVFLFAALFFKLSIKDVRAHCSRASILRIKSSFESSRSSPLSSRRRWQPVTHVT